jgi:hypothetical protein
MQEVNPMTQTSMAPIIIHKQAFLFLPSMVCMASITIKLRTTP